MNVLIDTCVWSLSLRRHRGIQLNADQQRMLAEFQRAIGENRACIVGIVRQEVLSGIRDKAQFLKIQQLLAPFLDEDVIPMDYVEAARLYNLCLDKGVQCGSADILIAAVAARRSLTVLTYDQALIRCLKVLRVPHL